MQQGAVLAGDPDQGAARQVGTADQPRRVLDAQLAEPADDRPVQGKGAAEQVVAASLQPWRFLDATGLAATASMQGGDQPGEQDEQPYLPGPGQSRQERAERTDTSGGEADPQQIAAGTEDFQEQEDGTEGQPVPEVQA